MRVLHRNRCFVEVLIMLLAAVAPSVAQIRAHGYASDCDRNQALPNDAHDNMESRWMRYFWGDSDRHSAARSSLAMYCVGEYFLQKHEYQASVNAYRDSLAGDGNPAWTNVWDHIQIGKIFDMTSQRERAVAQYQLAIETGDNTNGAIHQARELLQHPFAWPANP
jgi:hypothetical protein